MQKIIFHLIATSLIVVSLLSCTQQKEEISYPDHVGDIAFDPQLDNEDFQWCDENFVPQHYQAGTQYKGEEKVMHDDLKTQYKHAKIYHGNGYITIRFGVNCQGETGLFRVYQVNENYQKTSFHQQQIDQLLALTKSLDGWIPGKYKGKACDSYYFINYKIEDGYLTAIL